MKLITAVIKPFRLDAVREALTALGVEGLTVTEVRAMAVKRVIQKFTEVLNMQSIFFQN